MANDKCSQYTFRVSEELKKRLLGLPVQIHRSLADPMRARLEQLVMQAERKAAGKNGKV
jgi:predicted DNA-binding protein